MNQRDPLERELLARARAAYEPTNDARARMKNEIGAAVAAAALSSAAAAKSAGSVAGSGSAAGISSLSLGAKLAVGLVVGGLGVAGLIATRPTTRTTTIAETSLTEPATAERLEANEPNEPNEPNEAIEPNEALVVVPSEDERSAGSLSASGRSGSPRVEPRPEAPVDVLAQELALLDEAEAALVQGDASAALRALDRHRREHPHGALATEREVTRVLALCAARRLEEAQEAFEALRTAPLTRAIRAQLTASCAAH